MNEDNIHNRILKNILMIILCDPEKLSLNTFVELKDDLEKLNDTKLMLQIKDIDGFNYDEDFVLKEFENKA